MRHLRGYNPDTALDEILHHLGDLVRNLRQLLDAPTNVKGMIMALQADVQSLVDAVKTNTSAVQSMKQSFDLEAKQIAEQGRKITELQAQIAAIQPGQPVDAEDLAAIKQAASDVESSNSTLAEINTAVAQAAPANTQGNP